MATSAPCGLYGAIAGFEGVSEGQALELNVAGGETEGEEGRARVDGLGEEIGLEGEGADRFEHWGRND